MAIQPDGSSFERQRKHFWIVALAALAVTNGIEGHHLLRRAGLPSAVIDGVEVYPQTSLDKAVEVQAQMEAESLKDGIQHDVNRISRRGQARKTFPKHGGP